MVLIPREKLIRKIQGILEHPTLPTIAPKAQQRISLIRKPKLLPPGQNLLFDSNGVEKINEN